MEKVHIELPSIRDDESGYRFLFRLADNIINDPKRHFDFNFKKCAVIEQNAIAILGGLARYVDAHNTLLNRGKGMFFSACGVMFEVDSMSQIVRESLIKNNFLAYFSSHNFDGYPKGDYIGYREHTNYLDANEIALHLHNEWLSDEKLSMSPDLKNAIISRIFEIFMNAYGHGVEKSKIKELGVVSCGLYKKKERQLKLTVLDFGNGIIEAVKTHLKSDISDVNAMKWALETGNSTRTDSLDADIPRGLGFGLLSEFVTINEGQLSIFSNTCCAHVGGNNQYEVSSMKVPFSGTLVNVTINCDDHYYKFVSEDSDENSFF